MQIRATVPFLLVSLVTFLSLHAILSAKEPSNVTLLYTSDETGYLEPCG